MSTPISAPAVIQQRIGLELLRTHRILKRALTLLAAESFTRERLAVDSIAVYSQTGD